jgi:gelsolin
MSVILVDSNVAKIASQEAHDARHLAANADEWKGCGEHPGIEVWRVEDHPHHFGVKRWPRSKYGSFHTGDSYIVLQTFPRNDDEVFEVKNAVDRFNHVIFFWLGSKSSQDERGVAAYKTVELDDFLGTARGKQHRELQGFESDAFLTLFHGQIHYLEGGIASGFNHFQPEAFEPRLLRVSTGLPYGLVYESKTHRHAYTRVLEVPLEASSIIRGDAFILDLGTELIVWCCSTHIREKQKALAVAVEMREARTGHASYRVAEDVTADASFLQHLNVQDPSTWEIPSRQEPEELVPYTPKIFQSQVTPEGCTLIAMSDTTTPQDTPVLNENHVFLIDEGYHLYCYIGKSATHPEKAQALHIARGYITTAGLPVHTPITRVFDHHMDVVFQQTYAAYFSSSPSTVTPQ